MPGRMPSRKPDRSSRRQHPYRTDSSVDSWIAADDPYHGDRVELARWRRESIASNHSRQTSPMGPPSSRPRYPPLPRQKREDISSWRRKTLGSQAGSPSASEYSVPTTADQCMSPAQFSDAFKDQLDHYEMESRSLRMDEWVAPPAPRSRARRVSGKDYHRETARTLRRWSLVEGLMYGQNTSSLRDTDIKHPSDVYQPGTVFSAPFHTASTKDELYVAYDDPNLTAKEDIADTCYFSGTICSKYRKMVVVHRYGEHCSVMPIYTHNGKGLQDKNFLGEYVSIRDKDDPNPAPREGPYNMIHAVRSSGFTGTFIIGKSTVKLTELCNHRYDALATIEGHLDADSKRQLYYLLGMANKGFSRALPSIPEGTK
ncbi:hypothetical protein GGR52DRAFT_532979 [Hypoxylon sp. FL1284]|nr:hypothetical protein GGR52DRAFT_532979 [Hypoxylon sp. FL1284]